MEKVKDSKWIYIILSVLLAFILWLYVGKEANPTQNTTLRNIPVVFSGLDKLEERGLMLSSGAEQTVTLELQAKRDVLGRLNDNVAVTVDVSGIVQPGVVSTTYQISFPRTVSTDAIMIRDMRPEKVQFTVSKWASREIEVRGVFTGSVADGYQKGDFSFTPETITVSGQEELVSRVDYAQVTVTQQEMAESFSKDTPFTLIDFDGNPMLNTALETDVESILVNLPVVQLKEVPLSVELISGGGATEEDATVTISPKTIMVSGSEAALEPLKELSLGSIELYKIFGTDTLTRTIQLSPELTNVSGVTEATITIQIKGLATKTLEVNNIEIINRPDGYQAEAVTQSSIIQIRGSQEALDAIIPAQLRIVADLKDITPATGNQTVPVKVYLDGSSDVGVVGDYNIVVSITH